ncbi:MAG: hypothetical protein M3Y87_27340, partial [Myxococcota bacterium]|nr:hypothetical protein [Myxococcota bacterium]
MLLRLGGLLGGVSVFAVFVGCAVLAGGVVAAGCDGPRTLELDAGGPDAAAPSELGSIVIVGETAIGLTPRASARIVARWMDPAGRPVADRDVSFALDGMPRDSSLFSLVARTDADGQASGTVIAGELPATFRVRVAAPGATSAYVDVAVGAEGFGRLVVTVEGGDARTIARRTVRLHQGSMSSPVRCADALGRAEADRTRTVDESGVVELTALPAGQRFTVVARGENLRGTIVAEGCVAGVVIEVDREVRTTIELVARQLGVEGEYDTTLEVAPGTSPRVAVDAMLAALDAAVLAGGGDAASMLDALEAELRERDETIAADALATERLTGAPDAELASKLELALASPSRAVRDLLEEIATRSESLSIGGTLAIARATPEGSLASFTRGAIAFGAIGGERTTIDLASLGGDTRTPAAMRWFGTEDLLQVDEIAIALPLGRLVLAMIDALVSAGGAIDAAALLAPDSGCAALASWVAERTELAAACDDVCAAAACTRAIES